MTGKDKQNDEEAAVWDVHTENEGTEQAKRDNDEDKEPVITESSGNVFADLGVPDAEERFEAAQRYIAQYKAAEDAKKAQRLHYAMTIVWSEEDQAYLVQLPEWAAHLLNYKTATHGDTYEEAARNGREVLEMLLEGAVKSGERIPEPLVWTKEDQESEDKWDKLFASPESQADMAKQGRQDSEKPTLSPSYPTQAHGCIPAFQTYEEETAFWDSHDIAEFTKETTPVNVRSTPGQRKATFNPLTPEQQAQIDALAALPDDQIDTSDIPEITDFTGFQRGLFYRQGKVQGKAENSHTGSSFDGFLKDEGIYEECTANAISRNKAGKFTEKLERMVKALIANVRLGMMECDQELLAIRIWEALSDISKVEDDEDEAEQASEPQDNEVLPSADEDIAPKNTDENKA